MVCLLRFQKNLQDKISPQNGGKHLENTISVSQLSELLKRIVDENEDIKNLVVKGEVSNFTNHIKSGHFYFTLKDKDASIKAIMFKSHASKVKFNIENGMNVLINADVKLYQRDAACQLYCTEIVPDGIGALHLAFEQLKQKLAVQGLFDEKYKKPIPKFPKKIGVITSKTGAAFQDILNVLSRRYPLAKVVLIDTTVQGDKAAKSIVDGIKLAQSKNDIDVLIVGRGGGSIEDLWCFNEEVVAKAIFDCEIPIISAVGHEVDFTISDFVADLRAPTPSAAAEICTPNIAELKQVLHSYNLFIYNSTAMHIKRCYEKLKINYELLKSNSPETKVQMSEQKLNNIQTLLHMSAQSIMGEKERRYVNAVELLGALSPLSVLTRGYSITYTSEDKAITKTTEIKVGDNIKTILSDGEIISEVIKTKSK